MDGSFYSLGPLILEHVRFDSLDSSAFNASALSTLGASPNHYLIVSTSGTGFMTTLDITSAVAADFQQSRSLTQVRYRARDLWNNNDNKLDLICVYAQGPLNVDVLIP
ncbi:MAG: hypothetical protein SF187_24640 [Deltaproteobacteria bacterium]|nr:hypothetical protein [Deltaproteobacteria bacterium]